MSEQVSFYDKLKSDIDDDIYASAAKKDAAGRFASDVDLGGDDRALRQFVGSQAGAVRQSRQVPGQLQGIPADERINRIASKIDVQLGSEAAYKNPNYRFRLLDTKKRLANLAQQADFSDPALGGNLRALNSLERDVNFIDRLARTPIVPGGSRLTDDIDARRLAAGERLSTDPKVHDAMVERLRAAQNYDQIVEEGKLGRSTDRALLAAGREADEASEALRQAKIAMKEQRRRSPGSAANPNQLDLYRDAKNLFERYGDEALQAGRRALNSPTVKRGLGVAAGLMGSKLATAAASGGADLVAELAFGVPKTFVEAYDRGQDPYEQVKYVAEYLGPIDNLQSRSLDTLNYDDVVRLRQEGHLTPKAQQQYRQHVIDTDGFDPDELYRIASPDQTPDRS